MCIRDRFAELGDEEYSLFISSVNTAEIPALGESLHFGGRDNFYLGFKGGRFQSHRVSGQTVADINEDVSASLPRRKSKLAHSRSGRGRHLGCYFIGLQVDPVIAR